MTGATLIGLDGVLGNLQSRVKAIQANAEQALSDSLDELLGNAQGDCPVLTGQLRDSLTKLMASAQQGYIYTDKVYGPFVEMGTRKMAAQPFLYPNWKYEIPLFTERLRKAALV